ncbi:MAG: N-acetyltransferase family protein [Acidimicrobiia bacterium]
MTIEPMVSKDWPAVAAIYTEGIATGNATFETSCPEWSEWDGDHLVHSRLVARESGAVVGWAALSPISDRCAYGGVAEVSVYVATAATGRGIGTRLLAELINSSEAAGIWTLQAGIFPENISSLQMHVNAGFREIGTREKLGQLAGLWRDVTLLERRSNQVGL